MSDMESCAPRGCQCACHRPGMRVSHIVACCPGFNPAEVRADHPHADPGDRRTECQTCGKWVFECIHSCKRVPVTAAAWNRYLNERIEHWHNSSDVVEPLHTYLGMTWDEYAAWTVDAHKLPVGWLA